MRRSTARLAIAATAAAVAFAPAAALAQESPEAEPPEPEGGVLVNVEIDGVTPICINLVSISVFSTELVHIPKTCIAG